MGVRWKHPDSEKGLRLITVTPFVRNTLFWLRGLATNDIWSSSGPPRNVSAGATFESNPRLPATHSMRFQRLAASP
jgi:hypothetical protein